MSRPKPIGSAARTAEEEAAAWFARMSSDKKSKADEHEFDAWLAESPEHAHAFASFQKLWGDLGSFADEPEVIVATDEALHPRPVHRWLVAGGSLLALAAAAALVMLLPAQPTTTTYTTVAGQRSTINLLDHSAIELGPNSKLVVRIGPHERIAELVQGRAFFEVEHDASRPFLVRHEGREVRVIGTKFDVDTQSADFAVTLVSGSVQIKDILHDRQLATLLPNNTYVERKGGLSQVVSVDAEAESAWRYGRLVFNDIALSDAINQLNSFSPRPIRMGDERLSSLRVSGTFRIGETETTVKALEQSFGVRGERAADGSITLYAK